MRKRKAVLSNGICPGPGESNLTIRPICDITPATGRSLTQACLRDKPEKHHMSSFQVLLAVSIQQGRREARRRIMTLCFEVIKSDARFLTPRRTMCSIRAIANRIQALIK